MNLLGISSLVIILTSVVITTSYVPESQNAYLSRMLLSEIVNRMRKDDLTYPYGTLERRDQLPRYEDAMAMGYDAALNQEEASYQDFNDEDDDDDNDSSKFLYHADHSNSFNQNFAHPSLRDGEFLQHSSLWGQQYISGGSGEGQQRLLTENMPKYRQEVKSDSTLPAYCNPPNPCPVGYTAEQGCIEKFENTARFSRDYQEAQDCICDAEHMFDCPSPLLTDNKIEGNTMVNDLNKQQIELLIQQIKSNNNHGLVNKKIIIPPPIEETQNQNPFLIGEQLPVAAKKGFNTIQ